MSIFSSLRKSRQQAKEHNAKLAEQKKKEDTQVPYRHIPTHAATDAFASAPPSWREADRPRILEQNHRRSAMAASGHHMNMPGVPRVGSSLSRVSYPGEDVTPVVRLPRAYSYAGVSPYPASARQSREIIYPPTDFASMPVSLKGKEVPRSCDPQRISPASSKGGPSPMDSSDGSTSSQDDLEMKPSKPRTRTAEATTAHRLHPSHARRKSEPSANQYILSSTAKSAHTGHSRDLRPPPSMRGFSSITAIAAMAPTSVGEVSGYLLPQGQSGPSSSNTSSPSNTLTTTSRQGSATSLSGHSTGIAKQSASFPVTPRASTNEKNDHGLNWISLQGSDSDMNVRSVGAAAPSSVPMQEVAASPWTPQTTPRERQSVELHRNQEQEQLQQSTRIPQGAVPQQRMDRSRVPPPVTQDYLVNVFPEEAAPQVLQNKPAKSKKFSKGSGGKLLKKNRWSSSKTPAVAV